MSAIAATTRASREHEVPADAQEPGDGDDGTGSRGDPREPASSGPGRSAAERDEGREAQRPEEERGRVAAGVAEEVLDTGDAVVGGPDPVGAPLSVRPVGARGTAAARRFGRARDRAERSQQGQGADEAGYHRQDGSAAGDASEGGCGDRHGWKRAGRTHYDSA